MPTTKLHALGRTALFVSFGVVFGTTVTWGQGHTPPVPRKIMALVVAAEPPTRLGVVKFVAGTVKVEALAMDGFAQTVEINGDADVYVGATALNPISLPAPTRRNGFSLGFGRAPVSGPSMNPLAGAIHDSMDVCVQMAIAIAANPSSPRRLRVEFMLKDPPANPTVKIWDGSQSPSESDLSVLWCAYE